MNATSVKLPASPEPAGPIEDPIENLPVAYVEMDRNGAIVRANRLTRSLHSKHHGELIGKLAWELMPPDEQQQSCAAFLVAMETGQDPGMVRRSIYTCAGQFRTYEMHRNLIRDAAGEPVGMRVVSVDVTEADLARQEAERSRAWLGSVLDSIPEAVVVTDALGFIRYLNPAAEKLTGWKASELTGQVVEKGLPILAYSSGGRSSLNARMVLDKPSKGIATILDRERRELRVELSTSPMADKEQGFIAGVVTVLHPVEEARI